LITILGKCGTGTDSFQQMVFADVPTQN